MTEDQLQLMCGLVGCDTKFPLETFKIWDFQLDFFFENLSLQMPIQVTQATSQATKMGFQGYQCVKART